MTTHAFCFCLFWLLLPPTLLIRRRGGPTLHREGGIRVPGMFHYPPAITRHLNVTTPATTADFLPTIMRLLGVTSDNPGWAMDGIDLLPLVTNPEVGVPGTYVPRSKELVFWTNNQQAVIDNNWKIVRAPGIGQCKCVRRHTTTAAGRRRRRPLPLPPPGTLSPTEGLALHRVSE